MQIAVSPHALVSGAHRLDRVEGELAALRRRLVTTTVTVAQGVDGHTAGALAALARDTDGGLAHLVESVSTLSAALRDTAASYLAVDRPGS